MTAVAESKSVPAERGDRSQLEFSRLYSWVHSREPEWWTVGITFQRGPEWVRIGGARFRVQLSFFGTRWGWTRNSQIRYSVNISISLQGTLAPRQRHALLRSGALRDAARTLGGLGYRGEWHPRDTFGHFMKDLRSQAGLRQEIGRLEGVSFKALLGDVGPRATR